MDGGTDKRIVRQTDEWKNRLMNRQMDGQTDGWENRLMDGQIYERQMDGQTDKNMEG